MPAATARLPVTCTFKACNAWLDNDGVLLSCEQSVEHSLAYAKRRRQKKIVRELQDQLQQLSRERAVRARTTGTT
jgi:hypothetical protein